MKTILVYTVPHTGTWFTIRLLTSTMAGQQHASFGDNATQRRRWLQDRDGLVRNCIETGYSPEEAPALTASWAERDVVPYVEPFMKDGKWLVLQAHRRGMIDIPFKTWPWLLESIWRHEPEFPVVVPVRDPLLGVLSWFQRHYGWRAYRYFPAARTQSIVQDYMRSIYDLYLLPHSLQFPVDGPAGARMHHVFRLLKFCDLPPATKTLGYVRDWKIVNPAERDDGTIRAGIEDGGPFAIVKRWIRERKDDWVERIIPDLLEGVRLWRKGPIETLMRRLGYRDLIWWRRP